MTTASIRGFFGEYRWMSNFWESPVYLDGLCFKTVEHAYQAAKSLDFDYRCVVQALDTPAKAKRFGNGVFLRPDWDELKPLVMMGLLTQKFADPVFRQLLLDTGDAFLEETNTWNDVYWGVCNGKGLNMLGKHLMHIRDMLHVVPLD